MDRGSTYKKVRNAAKLLFQPEIDIPCKRKNLELCIGWKGLANLELAVMMIVWLVGHASNLDMMLRHIRILHFPYQAGRCC